MKSKHDKYWRAEARASAAWRRFALMMTASASCQCGDGLRVAFIHPDAMCDLSQTAGFMPECSHLTEEDKRRISASLEDLLPSALPDHKALLMSLNPEAHSG